jgi:hypothetical protein
LSLEAATGKDGGCGSRDNDDSHAGFLLARTTPGPAQFLGAERSQPHSHWAIPTLLVLFIATITETAPMPQIAVEIVLPGLHRPMRRRAFAPIDTAATLVLLDRWRMREEIAPEIAE